MKQAAVRILATRFVTRGAWTLVPCCFLMAAFSVAEPYKSSVVGTDYDFITDADPSTFARLAYKGMGLPEMPDKRNHEWPLRKKAHIFVAYFTDLTHVQISVHAGIGDKDAARTDALRYASRIGKLPTSLRKGLRRIVIQPGGRNTTAFADHGVFVLYSDNATRRIATHDLEETIFHESVHAAWDPQHRESDAWKRAQAADGRFITRYAKRNPATEDLAESALFAYTVLHHPKRFPANDRAAIRKAIPARIAFVEKLLPVGKAVHYPVESNLAAVLKVVASDLKRLAKAPDTPVHDGWRAEEPGAKKPAPNAAKVCEVDLGNPGELSDILSNALLRGLHRDEKKVAAFLRGPERDHEFRRSSAALLRATAKRFGLQETSLVAQVRKFLHCNCDHVKLGADLDNKKMGVLLKALNHRHNSKEKHPERER